MTVKVQIVLYIKYSVTETPVIDWWWRDDADLLVQEYV